MKIIAVSLCVATLLLAACELPKSNRPEEEDMFAITNLEADDIRVLWPILVREVEGSGFIMDRDKTNQITGEFETRWRMELAPYRYEGIRTKVIGVARELPVGTGMFTVRLTAWTQRNADIEDPMDPSKAIWQDVDPNKGVVDELLYRIQEHFPSHGRRQDPDEDSSDFRSSSR